MTIFVITRANLISTSCAGPAPCFFNLINDLGISLINLSNLLSFIKYKGEEYMLVKQFEVGGDRNYAYLAAEEVSGEAFIVDPSYAPEMLMRYAKDKGLTVKYNFCTHSHYDHTNGNETIRRQLDLPALLYGSVDSGTALRVTDGALLPLGAMKVQIIHTPGHTDDAMCLYIGEALFTGDTLFVGKVGGTDFGSAARQEYDALHQKLLQLPDKTRVFPGHNYGVEPQSTIGHERRTNPFLLQPDFASFVDLKRNWAEYKRKHNIA
jgi:hydroxyacylglutathione hydrolase